MTTSVSNIDSTLQKIFVLAAGFPADTLLAPGLAAQVAAAGNWTPLAGVLNGYLSQQASLVGATEVVIRMAQQGFGIALDPGTAAAIAAPIAAGQTTWADLVVSAATSLPSPYADILSNRAEAAEVFTAALLAEGKGALYPGSNLAGAAASLLQGVTADASTVDAAAFSLHELVTHLQATGLQGKAADGYLSGATVFVDVNGNLSLDAGEFHTTTDAAGNFAVSPGAPSGNLVAIGGTDILTGNAFAGVLTAPAGATVINPFTTLVSGLLASGGAASAQAAADLVQSALGLPAGLNLLNYDPLAVLLDSGATAQAQADALAAEATALQVMNVITQAAVSLDAATGLDLAAATKFIVDAFADALASGAPVDLTDASVIAGIVVDAVESAVGGSLNAAVVGQIEILAGITAASNEAAAGAGNLYALAQVAGVTQDTVPQALEDALTGGPGLDQVLEEFSGANLQALIDAEPVGQLVPGVPVTNTPVAPVITSNGAGDAASISVAENTKLVTTVAASDANGETTFAYSIAGGADAAFFKIDAVTGVLSFKTAPNYESAKDAGHNNVYDVVVQVSDGALVDSQAIAVTVTNLKENRAPTTTPVALSAIDEDSGARLITQGELLANAADADSNPLTATALAITAGSGSLVDNLDGTWSYTPAADDESSVSFSYLVGDGHVTVAGSATLDLTPVNDAPVITSDAGGDTASLDVAESATAVTTVTATDIDVGAVQTYGISGGADAAAFAIDASTGVLTFIVAPDYDVPGDVGGDNVYDVVVKVSDGTLEDTQAIAVTVTALNDNTPVITSNGGDDTAAVNVAENATAVTTVTATDADLDVGNTLAYTITGGADAGKFDLDATSGVLTFKAGADYEVAGDAGADNVYDVQVQVSDGTLTDTQDIAVTLTAVNDNTPVITSNGGLATAAVNVDENATAVTTVVATDADKSVGNSLTYTIIGGADAAKFDLGAASGVLTFKAGPDYEVAGDVGADNVYDVQVQVSDGTYTDTQTIAVTVTALNDNTPLITSNGGLATAAVNVAENATAVTTVLATDADKSVGNTLAYTIIGGADAAKFSLDSTTGVLTFKAGPDFEVAGDVGTDNVYDVQVQVSDGTFTDTQSIAVTVTAVNDNTPVITSNGGLATAAVNVAENATAVATVVATDSDKSVGNTLTYTITGGADSAKFSLDSSTGVLVFKAAPDFDVAGDVGADNIYDVQVQVSDGTFTDTQAIAVTVTAVNDNTPVITSNGGLATAAVNVAENVVAVTTVLATDADKSVGNTLAYTIIGGADAAKFSLDSSTGVLVFKAAPDYEVAGDVGTDNIYDVQVQVSDGTFTDTQTIAVTVTAVNDNTPVITSNGGLATAAVNVAENATAVTTVVATDADKSVGNTLAYTIIGGADATKFSLDSSTGVLVFKAAPDFEAAGDVGTDNIYDVQVQVSDGTFTDTQTIAVTVTAVNDNTPVITSNGGLATAAVNVSENATAVTTVLATDADKSVGNTLAYTITGGADAAKFSLDSSTGVLVFKAAPDFDVAGDVGADNVYDVQVQVSDGLNTDTQDIAVTVTALNDNTPVITSDGGLATAAVNVAENATDVTTVVATDADKSLGNTLAYTIIGGADAAKFSLNSGTGVLTFKAAPDFEAAGDVGTDNIYDVQVQVSDGTFTDTQTIAVTVTAVNDNTPVITSNGGLATAAVNVAENATAVTTVVATDADKSVGNTLAYTIIGGADAAKFSLDSTSGVLTFKTGPDFEAAGDVGTDNIYDVQVQVSDGTYSDLQDIAVTVTAVNDNTPVITSDAGGPTASVSIAENTSAVTTVTATDADVTTGSTLSYTLVAGGDSAKFSLNPTSGVLTFLAAPNFEVPTDSNTDNVYNVTVKVSDGTNADTQAIAVTVTNVSDADNDVLIGTAAADTIDITPGGNDSVTALAGDDTVVGGAAFTAADNLDGGVDSDTLTLAGNYSTVVTFLPTTLVSFEHIQLATGNSYNLKFNDATLASGGILTVDGAALVAGNTLTLNASLESESGAKYVMLGGNGANVLTGGAGADSLTGGAVNDTLTGGGSVDTLTGGDGNDVFVYGSAAEFIASDAVVDSVDGGNGSADAIVVNAAISVAPSASLARVTTVEQLLAETQSTSTRAHSIAIGLDSNLSSIRTIDLSGDTNPTSTGNIDLGLGSLTIGVTVKGVNGGGNNTLTGGSGDDTITGGAGVDFITGGAGVDSLTGGAGNDVFFYSTFAEFLASNAVVDVVDGGADVDAIIVKDVLTLTIADSLARVTGVEQLLAQSQSATTRVHSIVLDTDVKLSSIRTIDLSADTNSTSTGNVVLSGVSSAVTIKGVNGGGANTLTGGTGADTIVGGGGADTITGAVGVDSLTGGGGDDLFLYGSMAEFIATAAVIDVVDGGLGTGNTVQVNAALSIGGSDSLARVTNVQRLVAETQLTTPRAHSVTIVSNTNLSSITTIDLSGDTNATSTGSVVLAGVSNAVTLKGVNGGGTNVLTGGSAADSIVGGVGIDTITGGVGLDTLQGGAGNDIFVYASMAEFVASNAVIDSVDGDVGTADTAQLNAAFSLISGDSMVRLAGVEVLAAQTQSANPRAHSIVLDTDIRLATINTIDLSGDTNATSTGNVVLTGVSNAVTIKGANGTTSTNTLTGGTGADTIIGGAGADIITGAAGIDSLTGANGADVFVYGSMADFVTSNAVVDIIDGGGGSDMVRITGAITLTTLDTLATRLISVDQLVAQTQSASPRAHSIVLDTDAKLGTLTTIDLSGDTNATSTATVNLTSTSVAMTIKGVGGTGANTLTGGSGADSIFGGAGKDTISGAAGTDTITGGNGADSVTGGIGAADTFVFTTTSGVVPTTISVAASNSKIANTDSFTFGNGVDVITDFTTGVDKIDLATAHASVVTLLNENYSNLGTANALYAARGTYVSGTGVFTFSAAGADTIVLESGANGSTLDSIATNTGIVILVGMNGLPAAGDFI